MPVRKAVLSLFLLLLTFLGCTSTPPGGDGIVVTVSIFPLADVVRNIGGERVRVRVLIPPGASPHLFEPAPEAFRHFSETQLFVMVGAGLEFWAEKLIAATASEDLLVIRAADGVPLIQMGGHQHGGGSRPGGDDTELGNPHLWLDPVVVRDVARRVGQTLMRLDPEHAGEYRHRLTAYEQQLERLDESIRSAVSQFRTKEYVAFHPAWSYFSRRYGLHEVGVIQRSPGRDPTPKQIEAVINSIREYGIDAVFAEPQFNPAAARAIAREAGAKVLLLDPLGGPDIPGRDSYIGLMQHNLDVIGEVME